MLALVLLAALSAADVRVIDGDTIRVAGVTWRLKGYDAPETAFARCAAERRLGERAKARLKALIAGARSLELVDTGRPGGYGRRLGELVVDGRRIQDLMIPDYARPCGGPGCRKTWCQKGSKP